MEGIYLTIIIVLSIVLITTVVVLLNKINSLREVISKKEIDYIHREKQARKDSIKRSKSVLKGAVIEKFAPFTPSYPIPVENSVFLGQPIDFIGFTDKNCKEKCEVHFIEVKSGQSQLSKSSKKYQKCSRTRKG